MDKLQFLVLISGYIAIFELFKMAAAAILNFQKLEILTAFPL